MTGPAEPFLMLPARTPEADRKKSRLGLVQVYTGGGKGKTTASLGLAMRAAGHGYRVAIVQFLKSGYSGEVLLLRKHPELPIRIVSYGKRCANHARHMADIERGEFESFCEKCFESTPEDAVFCGAALEEGRGFAVGGEYDLVILDEVNVALHLGLIKLDDVLGLIGKKHPKTELVLTGRNAKPEIIAVADMVNEVTFIKNPYERGIFARKGIEF